MKTIHFFDRNGKPFSITSYLEHNDYFLARDPFGGKRPKEKEVIDFAMDKLVTDPNVPDSYKPWMLESLLYAKSIVLCDGSGSWPFHQMICERPLLENHAHAAEASMFVHAMDYLGRCLNCIEWMPKGDLFDSRRKQLLTSKVFKGQQFRVQMPETVRYSDGVMKSEPGVIFVAEQLRLHLTYVGSRPQMGDCFYSDYGGGYLDLRNEFTLPCQINSIVLTGRGKEYQEMGVGYEVDVPVGWITEVTPFINPKYMSIDQGMIPVQKNNLMENQVITPIDTRKCKHYREITRQLEKGASSFSI